jgi:NAD+ synthase (glutamine-hydrolysing)
VPRTEVAGVAANLSETVALARQRHECKAALMAFPELGLSAYTIEDLLFQDALLTAVEQAIDRPLRGFQRSFPILIVRAPLRDALGLFNTGVVIHRGSLLGVVPKTYPPNYREFYEKRHFASGAGIRDRDITIAGRRVPFGVDLLFPVHRIAGPNLLCRDLRGLLGAPASFDHGRNGRCRGAGEPLGEQHHHRQA